MEFLKPVLDEIHKHDPLEPGEEQSFVLDDAVVVVSLSESRELKVQVCLGPVRLKGVKTGLLEDEAP